MVLFNRCAINGKNATDCILHGIEDKSIRTSAEAAHFSDPNRLLVFLRNVKTYKRTERTSLPSTSGISDSKRPKFNKFTSITSENRPQLKCFNCGEEGHSYYKCKQAIKRCESCKKVGHLVNECFKKKDFINYKNVMQILKENENDLKYFKSAKLNGHVMDCFIDFGSQCTMLKESIARTLVNEWSVTDLPTLKGFGDSIVSCLGKCKVTIEIDSVQASLEVLIVPDQLLRVPLLLGQTFTEQDHVLVYKNKDSLRLLSNEQSNDKIFYLLQ